MISITESEKKSIWKLMDYWAISKSDNLKNINNLLLLLKFNDRTIKLTELIKNLIEMGH